MAVSKTVTIPVEDFKDALRLADKFNVQTGAVNARKVKAVLTEAVGFLISVTPVLAEGGKINVGSPYHDDLFLDRKTAQALAQKKDKTAYLSGKTDVQVSQKTSKKLSSLRRDFQLASNGAAAALALRVYDRLCDNLWRGNNFSMTDKDGKGVPLEADTIKETRIRGWNTSFGRD